MGVVSGGDEVVVSGGCVIVCVCVYLMASTQRGYGMHACNSTRGVRGGTHSLWPPYHHAPVTPQPPLSGRSSRGSSAYSLPILTV